MSTTVNPVALVPRLYTEANDAVVDSRIVTSSVERLIVRFEPIEYPEQSLEGEPDFDSPRTLAQLAEEQRAFIGGVREEFVDIEMPDND